MKHRLLKSKQLPFDWNTFLFYLILLQKNNWLYFLLRTIQIKENTENYFLILWYWVQSSHIHFFTNVQESDIILTRTKWICWERASRQNLRFCLAFWRLTNLWHSGNHNSSLCSFKISMFSESFKYLISAIICQVYQYHNVLITLQEYRFRQMRQYPRILIFWHGGIIMKNEKKIIS